MNNSSTSASSLIAELRRTAAGLAPGERFPGSRELISRYEVGPGTVARAVATLVAEGLLVTRPGSGTYVARRTTPNAPADTSWQAIALADRAVDPRSAAADPATAPAGAILLDGGYLHRSLQPERALSAALARAARRPDAWDRAPASGLSPLRALFAAPAGVTPEDVLITSGGQNALSVAFRAVAAPGSPILVESPTYHGALAAARNAGLRPVPVPVDDDGVRPELLAEAFEMTGARVFYCQPAHQNPTGAILARPRRLEVLDVARSAGAFVVEDDFARHLSHGPAVPPPLITLDTRGSVVYLTSLTKPAAPSLRIGALIARGPVAERLRASRRVDDFFVSRPLQEAAVELLGSPAWQRHLRTLAVELRRRCHTLVDAISNNLPTWSTGRTPSGGLHLWVRLPDPGPPSDVLARSAARNLVTVSPGHRHHAAEPAGTFLRLNFAATPTAADLVEGVQRLATAARTVAGRGTPDPP